ncbi:unnamed protein product [Rhizophagus irregularis]|nr:unnamed protein product [Rhizophagus irregularis]
MNAIPNQRPTDSELCNIIFSWIDVFDLKGKCYKEVVRTIFEEADKEIPNISTSYEKNPDAIYTSRLFTYSNLSKPINSPIITSYLNEEDNKDCQDSQLLDLEVPSSLQSREIVNDENGS